MQFHFIGGRWVEGNPPLITAWSHGAWMGTIVFDGARAFEGVTPDLDRHCARMVRSVEALGMRCPYSAGELVELSLEGVRRFPKEAALYIRPMAWSEDGFLAPDPETTQFVLSVVDSPLPEPNGFSACLSSFRRPSPEVAPTEAKAACHYTNSGRAEREAKGKGFDNAVMLDPIGHVAEFATANLFIAKDGVVHTPVPNQTFLNGITRQRIIGLLRRAGTEVQERTLTFREVLEADEVFSTGNYGKVLPTTRIEQRHYPPGPIAARARELYWEFAHAGSTAA
jgi:branched-chain amino acid aminotransferase